MGEIHPPLSPIDLTTEPNYGAVVEDNRRYLMQIAALQEEHTRAMAALRKRFEPMPTPLTTASTVPGVKVDEDVREAYAAGLMTFEHACLVQLLRNTGTPAAENEQPSGQENTGGVSDGDAAGHASDPRPKPG